MEPQKLVAIMSQYAMEDWIWSCPIGLVMDPLILGVALAF